MDITPAVSKLLVQSHSSKPIPTASAHLTDTLDSFLREAYQINKSLTSLLAYLRAIRQPYLSSAPPPRQTTRKLPARSSKFEQDIPVHLTDSQREDIDSETSAVLRDVNSSISNLSSAATLQHDTTTQLLHKKYGRPTSLLFRWAAGSDSPDPDAGKSQEQVNAEGQTRTTKEFRDAVLWYLRMKLEFAARSQAEMVDQRVEREREKGLSRLSDVRNKGVQSGSFSEKALNGDHELHGRKNGAHAAQSNGYGNIDLRGHDPYDASLDASAGDSGQQQLSEDQLQLFEEENQGLFSHFNEQLAKITQAEKSLREISSLQQTLLGHLTVQGEQIGNLAENADQTGEDLRRGNKELKRAGERGSTAKTVFWGTAGLCSFLVVWDLIF